MNNKEATKHFYNETASQVFREWFNNPALTPTLKKFMRDLPEKPKILDLGCGTGGECKRLIELGAKLIGIDFSEKSINYAKENVPEAQFLQKDILDMNFEKNFFDGVLEAGVLFHLSENEQNQVLKNIFTILKNKGSFLSYYPEGLYEGMQEITVFGKILKRYSRQIPIDSWINQVMKNGFRKYVKHEFNIGSFKCVQFFKDNSESN